MHLTVLLIASKRPQTQLAQTLCPIIKLPLFTLLIGMWLYAPVQSNATVQSGEQNDDGMASHSIWQKLQCQPPSPSKNPSSAINNDCEKLLWDKHNIVRIHHLYLSDQPDMETLTTARKNGVKVLINFCDPTELSWDEAQAAKNIGLTYYNVPLLPQKTGFDRAAIEQISQIVEQHTNEKIFIHCSSGNRVSAWLAIYLSQYHHLDLNKALDIAKYAGLTSTVLEAKIHEYLASEGMN